MFTEVFKKYLLGRGSFIALFIWTSLVLSFFVNAETVEVVSSNENLTIRNILFSSKDHQDFIDITLNRDEKVKAKLSAYKRKNRIRFKLKTDLTSDFENWDKMRNDQWLIIPDFNRKGELTNIWFDIQNFELLDQYQFSQSGNQIQIILTFKVDENKAEDESKSVSSNTESPRSNLKPKKTETIRSSRRNQVDSKMTESQSGMVDTEKPKKRSKKWPDPPWYQRIDSETFSEGIPLDLAQSIQIARLNSLAVRITQEDVLLARWKVGAAKRGLWPSFNLLAEMSSGTTTGQDYSGREYTLEFQWPLYKSGKQKALLKQAWLNYEIAQRNYQKEVTELDFKVEQAYFVLVNSYIDLENLYALKEDIQRDIKVSKERYQMELSRELEWLKVQGKLVDINYRISAAEKDLELAELTLKQILGNNNEIPFYIKADLEDYQIQATLDQCVSLAIENRSDLLVNELLVDYNRFGKIVTDSEYKWNFELEGSMGLNDEAFDTEELSLENEYFVGLKFNKVFGPHTLENNFVTQDKVPAVGQTTSTKFTSNTTKFYFWNSQAKIDMKDADIKLLKSIDELEKKKNSVVFDVRKGFYEFIKSREQLSANQEKVDLAEKELVVAKAREMLNETLISDTLEAKDKYTRALTDLAQSKSSYFTAIAELNKAIGITDYFDVKRGVTNKTALSDQWIKLINDPNMVSVAYRGLKGWNYFLAGKTKGWKRWKWKNSKPPKEITQENRYSHIQSSLIEDEVSDSYEVNQMESTEISSDNKEELISKYLDEGKVAYRDKDFNKAVQIWEKVLKIDAENTSAQKYIERAKARMEK